MGDSGGGGDSRSDRQKKADDRYTREVSRVTQDDPNRNITGFADPLKVVSGSSLKDAGFDMALRDAYNEKQRADVEARNMRPDGTMKDDKPAKKAASAVETVEDEEVEEEETTTPATPVDTAQETVTQLANTTVSAEAANRPRSQAETEAAADKTAGYKSGTIATSPSGVSNEDTSGLRPKKSAMARTGLLTDDDDPKKKKTLIA